MAKIKRDDLKTYRSGISIIKDVVAVLDMRANNSELTEAQRLYIGALQRKIYQAVKVAADTASDALTKMEEKDLLAKYL